MTIEPFASGTAKERRFGNCRWVPWAFVAAFAVVFAVNGGLIYFALASWSGLTTDHAYDEGLAYNRVIAEAEKEATLGWKLAIAFVPDGKGKESGQLVVDASDRDGVPLERLAIKAELVRPLGVAALIPVVLERTARGRYAAPLALPQPGQWDVYVTAAEGGTMVHAGRRILAP
ncbi:MAG: FixH family protein [Alphaproteobacteria bacterium]